MVGGPVQIVLRKINVLHAIMKKVSAGIRIEDEVAEVEHVQLFGEIQGLLQLAAGFAGHAKNKVGRQQDAGFAGPPEHLFETLIRHGPAHNLTPYALASAFNTVGDLP